MVPFLLTFAAASSVDDNLGGYFQHFVLDVGWDMNMVATRGAWRMPPSRQSAIAAPVSPL